MSAELMTVEQKRDVIKSHYPIGITIYPYDDTSAIVTGYKNWLSGCTLRVLYDDGSRGTFPPEQGDRGCLALLLKGKRFFLLPQSGRKNE